MYRIALCDNSIEDLEQIHDLIVSWQKGHSTFETQLVSFNDPEKMQMTLTHNFYDLYILDILMPGISGIALAREIRESNLNVPIIFTTSSKEFALEAYDVTACRYLVKPVQQASLDEALNYALKLDVIRSAHPLTVHSGFEHITIVREDIMYIENEVRTSIYAMKDGRRIEETRRSGLFEDAVSEAVQDACFIQTHKSYFVNMNYISSMSSESIVMDDGTAIPINRKRCEEVQKAYLAFISHESGKIK